MMRLAGVVMERVDAALAESGIASLPDSCWDLRFAFGGTMGLPPHALLEAFIPKPHLRFAAV